MTVKPLDVQTERTLATLARQYPSYFAPRFLAIVRRDLQPLAPRVRRVALANLRRVCRRHQQQHMPKQ
jgi:hypothetical protein